MGTQPEETTTVEGIDNTLAELLKIAEGANIVKALDGAVDTTGHTDERGKVAGSLAEPSDSGELDSMMIGKMRQSMIDSGIDAGSIAAFMAKMGGGDDEDDDGDKPAGQPFGKFGRPASSEGSVAPNPRVSPTGGSGERSEKSLDAFRGQEQLAKAMDVSPFLSQLVASTSEQMDSLAKSIRVSRKELRKSLDEKSVRDAQAQIAMAKGLSAAIELVKSQQKVISELGRRLNIVESTPQPPRGRTNLGKSDPSNPLGTQPQQLTKDQAVRVLSYCGLEKSNTKWGKIAGTSAAEIASLAEAGASLTKSHVSHVLGFLAAHPSEAQSALGYR